MNTRTVTVQIQADFFEENPSEKEIKDWVSAMNNALSEASLTSDPQILPDSVQLVEEGVSPDKMIEEIKRIISEHGNFSVGEVQADCSPCVDSIGETTTALAEAFYEDHVEVQMYHDADGVAVLGEEYEETYEKLPYDAIEDIYELALQWERNEGK